MRVTSHAQIMIGKPSNAGNAAIEKWIANQLVGRPLKAAKMQGSGRTLAFRVRGVARGIRGVAFCNGHRHSLTPVPQAERLASLNDWIRNACLDSRSGTIRGKQMTVSEASERERASLLPVAQEGFPLPPILSQIADEGADSTCLSGLSDLCSRVAVRSPLPRSSTPEALCVSGRL